ncbi:TIGR02680 family protein [Actinocrispum wychmicini]|uniref:Uncharacterized protein (TIGR02680 family) n=1 Tax=Actinocrispum wychmicini TaxID=1213861 RepID=A0A4R2J965_9PSEU|nr:TIGR02680 family protein [Actinocrispum wychmicini]TCO53138.1 uncharacterized protein (TIGR02680 family) [Actinocrispum wychmicini]
MTVDVDPDTLLAARPKHHPHRWRLARAGVVNVWYYYDTTFQFTGGRMILRGTNGSGKSRALEMLLPFLLDADRRKMDATGSGKVRLEDLMRHGAHGQNRLGYLWLELARQEDDQAEQFLTIGALVRFSVSTGEAKPWYFTTPLRVGVDLPLMDDRRQPLSREHLGELIGADRITEKADVHRERVGATVFGLSGNSGKERYGGLLQLLHTLRAPDMGNRIDEGNLPKILSDALPPLSENTLREAGERLDSLSDSREEQRRLVEAVEHIDTFLDVYRRYTVRALFDTAEQARVAAIAAKDFADNEQKAEHAHAALVLDHSEILRRLAEARAQDVVLQSTIEGIKDSDAYKAGLNIENLAQSVSSLGRAAGSDLSAAVARRQEESAAVRRIDTQAEEIAAEAKRACAVLNEVRQAASGARMPITTLPATVAVDLTPQEPPQELVRSTLTDAPELFSRPSPTRLEVVPDDVDEAHRTVVDAAQAMSRRSTEATSRLATAKALDNRENEVSIAEDRAEELSERAAENAAQAQDTADDRDDRARALATAWRRWTADDQTRSLLGDIDWASTAVGPLLIDADALTGEPAGDDLTQLDEAASESSSSARNAIADSRATLRREDLDDKAAREHLLDEQNGLRADRDSEPPAAPWMRTGPPGSVPLWRTVEFGADLNEVDRAGLEAALLSAGLLSAALSTDGTVRAEDGQVLLTLDAPEAVCSLTTVLQWDPASGLPRELVTAVLSRVGSGPGHGTWVDVDGRWGSGPLQGKNSADRARYVGAAARAAARAERLAEIDEELAKIQLRSDERTRQLARLTEAEATLKKHVRAAPRTTELDRARTTASIAAATAARSLRDATTAHSEAVRRRRELTEDSSAHEQQCSRLGLPYDQAGLADVAAKANQAKENCRGLADRLDALRRRRSTRLTELQELGKAIDERRQAEFVAEESWREWHSAHAKFAALQEAVGTEAKEVRERLKTAKTAHRKVGLLIDGLTDKERELDKKSTAAELRMQGARVDTRNGENAMRTALTLLTDRSSLAGVAEAATGGGRFDLPAMPEVPTSTDVEQAAVTVQRALERKGKAADENALMRALQAVSAGLSNTFDLSQTRTLDVWLIDLTDATGRYPVAVAAARLREQAERGASALTDREHKVFTDFVIGGVGEELRRRLGQAEGLVTAMNTSLRDIRTSHGIGVRLKWELVEPKDSPIGRIRELVQSSAAIRSTEETDELIRLLKDRVDDRFKEDPDGGYSAHLRSALDYRQWHRVEVFILGPAPGQERKISRRARLSQGETRFVSYVALFAAADAYLSGLPDTSQALRLILLDDAFAKVDDRTIAELMGLLVRLDVDFCMTGHALWGTYSQVPGVDVYEIRRAEGTAAVATHVHWDGRARHYLRSAG